MRKQGLISPGKGPLAKFVPRLASWSDALKRSISGRKGALGALRSRIRLGLRAARRHLWWSAGFVLAVVFVGALTLWMAGDVYTKIPRQAELGPHFRQADVIVVLTGGRGRIRRALELYERGYGKVLYISGTDRQVQIKEILKELKWIGPVDDTHIILENQSTNTMQNALHLHRFVTEQGLKRVLLVTSIYHVRRAHYIFRQVLPKDIEIELSWFEQEPFVGHAWWTNWNGIWVTVSEFFKFFYAWLHFLVAPASLI